MTSSSDPAAPDAVRAFDGAGYADAEYAEPEPQRHLGHLLRRAQQLHVATWTRVVSTEITSVQYSILAILDRRGAASQRELCDDIDLDRSTVADLVARMERRGLIERQRDTKDARRNTVRLSERGLAERRRLAPLVHEVQQDLVGAMPPEDRATLRRLLQQLLAPTHA